MKKILVDECSPKLKQYTLVAAVTFALALVFEALTLIGAPGSSVLDLGAWGKKRILVVWIALIALYALCRYFGVFGSIREWVMRLLNNRQAAISRILFLSGGFLLSGLVCLLLGGLLTLAGFFTFGFAKGLFCFSLGGAVFLVYANRRHLSLRPECVFVPVGIVMGIAIALLTPVQTSVSFDDHIHYDHALALSYLSSPEYTVADMTLLSPPYVEGTETGYWSFSEEDYRAIVDGLNSMASDIALVPDGFVSAMGSSTLQYSYLGYIPGAIGLWLGRLLQLPFDAVFLFGRISSVLFFFTLVYFSVKKLKSQKILALAFALIPSILFISANYSYDTWVTGWLLFGFLRYLSWLQNPDQKLSCKEVAIVLLSFIVGLGPKAIYFPIFFLLLFIPKAKFPNKIFARRYRIVVVLSALLVLSTFLLPFVVQGPGGGDIRGGSDVNSANQVMFVLEDPLRYMGILANFLFGYLSLEGSSAYTNLFAYLGTSTLGALPLVALLLVAVTDSGSANYPYAKWRYRFGALALLIGTSALMASALYVSFTAVGSETVAGCQGRYLLPLAVPFLSLFFNSKMRNENSRALYSLVVLSVSMAFIVVCVSQLSLGVYVG